MKNAVLARNEVTVRNQHKLVAHLFNRVTYWSFNSWTGTIECLGRKIL